MISLGCWRGRAATWVAALLCAVSLLSGAVRAHEIGTTQARATIAGGRFELEVIVDPDALLTRLQVRATNTVVPPTSRQDRDARIDALLPVFLDATHLRFDGIVVAPQSATYRPASALSDIARAPSAVVLRGRVPAGAQRVSIDYGFAVGTYALVVRVDQGEAQTIWTDGATESPAIALDAAGVSTGRVELAIKYLRLGFSHIVPKGIDHILFVLGLFLLSTRRRAVLAQVSAFTLAHSITLALTVLGVVSLPARVVEPLIALSIAYVAVENLFTDELKSWRMAMVFGFGLLHGMGFAGVLRDLGLPARDMIVALATFNIGVEAGQLLVVFAALVCVSGWRVNAPDYRRYVVQPASVALAVAGVWWTLQRLV